MSSTDRPTRPEMQRMAFGQQPFAGLFFDARETKDYMDALETENQRLRKSLNYATTDLEPEDVALTWQIANGQWEPDPPRTKS